METIAVEILKTVKGLATKNGELTFTKQDLHHIADASNRSKYLAPIKLGHHHEWADGEPALGTLKNYRVVGESLIADLIGMPGWLHTVLPYAFPASSIELTPGSQLGYEATKHDRYVCTGLALLGRIKPAIPGLKRITKIKDVTDLLGVSLDAQSGETSFYIPIGEDCTMINQTETPVQANTVEEPAAVVELEEAGGVVDQKKQPQPEPQPEAELDETEKDGSEEDSEEVSEDAKDAKIAVLKTEIKALQKSINRLSAQIREHEEKEIRLEKTRQQALVDNAVSDGRIRKTDRPVYLAFFEKDPQEAEQHLAAIPMPSHTIELGHSLDDSEELETPAQRLERYLN